MGRKRKRNPVRRFTICLPEDCINLLVALDVLRKDFKPKKNISEFMYSLLRTHYRLMDVKNRLVINEMMAKADLEEKQNEVDIANRELLKSAKYLAEVRVENKKKGIESIYEEGK